MGFMTFTNIAGAVDVILAHWELSLLVLAAFTVLCIGLFKGFGKGFKALVWVLVVLALVWVADLAVHAFTEDLQGFIGYAIGWTPTAIFFVILLVSTLVNAKRGLHKSLVLLVQSVCAVAVCLTLFFVCISWRQVDVWLLQAVNAVMGGPNALQNTLGASAECETLREVFADYLPSLLDGTREIGILLRDNGAYVMTLVDLGYRIALAIVCWVLYLVLVFLLYLIYAIFYPERRYKKKKNLAFARNQTDCSYKKRHTGGGVVGLCRGLVTGLITMSFIGSVFFIAAGGTGETQIAEISFGNKNADYAYSIYRSVESYGAQGIFKVLNTVKDPEDTPYYLFAADLVLSGGLDDEKHGIHENIRFRKEIGAYTGFAKDTLNLLLKYGEAEIAPVLRGEGGSDAMNAVLGVTALPEFRLEFEALVDRFDAQTYFINFSLSLVDSVIANLDDMSFASSVGEDNKELLKVLFKRGHLSETIPDERAMIAQLGTNVATEEKQIHPCLNVNKLFTKRDAQTVLRVALSLLSGEVSVKEPLTLAKTLLPQIESLSVFSSERSEEISPVLGRLYCYLENKYLTEAGGAGLTYASLAAEKVDWSREIRSLLGVSDDLFAIYDRVKGGNIFQSIASMFDESDPDYAQNIARYDNVSDRIADSALLGKVLSSGKMGGLIRTQLQNIGENVYVPDTIVYENKYDEAGNLISNGEAYQLLRGLRLLGDGENKALVESIFSSSADFKEVLDGLAAAIAREDDRGKTLSDYFTDSVLLRSVVSNVLMEQGSGIVAVPTLSLETDSNRNPVRLINKAELKELFDALPKTVDLILSLAEGEVSAEDVAKLLENETLNELLDGGNKIVEGTAANAFLKQTEGNPDVIIPRRLQNFEEWVTYGKPGELKNLLAAVRTLGLDLTEVIQNGVDGNAVLDRLKELEREQIEEMLQSDVLHYTVSEQIKKESIGFGSFTLVIPASSRTPLTDDVVPDLIVKSELVTVFTEVGELNLSENSTTQEIVRALVRRKELVSESFIFGASVANYLVSDAEIRDALNLPARYLEAGSSEELAYYGKANVWYPELPLLITALDEIFSVSAGADFSLDGAAISDRMNELLRDMNKPADLFPERTKLEVCYDSEIIRNDLTVELDKALDGVVKESVRNNAKEHGYYTIAEMRALSDAADLFGLDFLKMEGSELTDKVKGELMNANKPHADRGGKTTLEIIYPSVIIRNMTTEEIDKAVGADKIDLAVRDGLKKDSVYPQAEVSALVAALDELEIESTDKVGDFDFAQIGSFNGQSKISPEKTRLNALYESDLVGGMITYSVKAAIGRSGGKLRDHARAYRAEIAILEETEIASLVTLVGNGKLEEYDVNAVSLSTVCAFAEADGTGRPRSYLVTASLSAQIAENDGLVVPARLIGEGLIENGELIRFLDAFSLLQGEGALGAWNVENDLVLPDAESRRTLTDSEILRATLSRQVAKLNGGIAIARTGVFVGEDGKGNRIAVLSQEELLALFSALDACGTDGGRLELPEFNLDYLVENRANLGALYVFDGIRYRVSAVMRRVLSEEPQEEEVYTLTCAGAETVAREETAFAYPLETVLEFLNGYEG